MKKSNVLIAVFAVMLATASGTKAGPTISFDGKTTRGSYLPQEPALVPPAGAPVRVAVGADMNLPAEVNFDIRPGFYGNGTIAAFDAALKARVTVTKAGTGWKAEMEIDGKKEAGQADVSAGKAYRLTFGAIMLEISGADGTYELTGMSVAGDAPLNADAELKTLGGGLSFSYAGGAGTLVFRGKSVKGSTDRPRLAAAVTALYLVMLGEQPAMPARSVEFTRYNPSWDENGYGWVPCSEGGMTWDSTDTEWRTMKKDGNDIYVCDVDVTWHNSWRGCRESNPHTSPGYCSCRISSQKSARVTDRCAWQAAG
ncbi:MAG: hypothetical protein NTY45_13890 [Elusimicrobia bacterium]|nr:hypothetical protein [Elusimicrobiota bacterium]